MLVADLVNNNTISKNNKNNSSFVFVLTKCRKIVLEILFLMRPKKITSDESKKNFSFSSSSHEPLPLLWLETDSKKFKKCFLIYFKAKKYHTPKKGRQTVKRKEIT